MLLQFLFSLKGRR